MEKLKFGIIGFGNMGSGHAKTIMDGKVPKMELCAICDIDPERIAVSKKLYPDVATFDNATALINSGLCDTIIVATPHYDHAEIAIEGLRKGLNVITEKPAGVYTKQVLEMNEVAKNSKGVFGIMYNQRTNPVYRKLREMILNGELGGIKRVQWTITDWYRPQAYHDSSEWRSTWKTEGGGALINQNPHQLDLWQWMFGMPSKIWARAGFGKYHNIETEDDVTIFMEYENGMTGTYITSTGEAPGTNRLEIACDMGKVVVEQDKIHFTKNEISEREFDKINTKPFGSPEKTEIDVEVVGENPEHKGILNNFAEAVLSGEELLAPGYEGVKGLTISNSAHLSAWTGEVVDVNNFPHEKYYELLMEKIEKSTYVKPEVKKQVVNLDGTF
ncbi:MAG: Gfo/Idh/MocA family oxidoreductase [Clostridia bacterium]|nr:Gfo/Idh/MocA family oxidoreductase [Clostridia bacterium]